MSSLALDERLAVQNLLFQHCVIKVYLTVRYRKKTMDFSFSCVCPVIDNEFGHNMVKAV